MLEVLLDAIRVTPAPSHASLLPHVDFSHMAIGGHSRGGSISAFHVARDPFRFFTAVFADPVDLSDNSATNELL